MKELLHVLLILSLMLPCMVAFMYALKYILARPLGSKHSSQAIQITHQLAIGSKERLLCVNIDGTRLLLGMTPQSIATLHVFDEPGTPSAPKESA
jgi:flagellar protein FliO/FliZ